MKSLFALIPFGFVVFLLLGFVTSCQEDIKSNARAEINLISRAGNSEHYPEPYSYKTLISFANGHEIGAIPNNLEHQQISIAIVYDNDAPWAESLTNESLTTGDYKLNQLLTQNNLSIQHQFQIDGYNQCLILDLNTTMEDIALTCKKLSEIDHVSHVDIKEWPSSPHTSTAASH